MRFAQHRSGKDSAGKMPRPVLLIRATGNESDAAALSELGISSLIDPYLEIAVSDEKDEALDLFNFLNQSHGLVWLIATSVNAIKHWSEIVGTEELKAALMARKDLRYAAIGQATAKVLMELGASQVLIPDEANAASLATALVVLPPGIALIPGGNLAMTELPRQLEVADWTVKTAVVYTTTLTQKAPESVALVDKGEVAGVLLRSPSAAQAFLTHIPHPGLLIVCAGTTTAKTVEDLGIKVDAVAKDPSPATVAAAIESLLTRQES